MTDSSQITINGTYAICVKLEDSYGNITYADSGLTFVVDTMAEIDTDAVPYSLIVDDGYLNSNDVMGIADLLTAPSGSDVAVAEYALVTNGDCSTASWSTTKPATNTIGTDGSYSLCYRTTDLRNNRYIKNVANFIKDTTAPNITSVTAPTNFDAFTSSSITVTGTCSDDFNAVITTPLGNDNFNCTNGQVFTKTYNLSGETSDVTIGFGGQDAAGNSMSPFANMITWDNTDANMITVTANSNYGYLPGDQLDCVLNMATPGYDANGNSVSETYMWSNGQNSKIITLTEADRNTNISCSVTATANGITHTFNSTMSQPVYQITNQCANVASSGPTGFNSGDGSNQAPYFV